MKSKYIIFTIIIAAIVGAIFFLSSQKPGNSIFNGTIGETIPAAMPTSSEAQARIVAKVKQYSRPHEITDPTGFVNTEPLKLTDLIGKKVIMIDFWTYSCINCQRTLPYLNA